MVYLGKGFGATVSIVLLTIEVSSSFSAGKFACFGNFYRAI